jgi:hypothetical protein
MKRLCYVVTTLRGSEVLVRSLWLFSQSNSKLFSEHKGSVSRPQEPATGRLPQSVSMARCTSGSFAKQLRKSASRPFPTSLSNRYSDWVRDVWSRVLLPTGTKHMEIFLLQNVQTPSGAHAASYSMATRDYWSGINRQRREVNNLPPTTADVKNEGNCTSAFPRCLHCVDRDDFTFCTITRIRGAPKGGGGCQAATPLTPKTEI